MIDVEIAIIEALKKDIRSNSQRTGKGISKISMELQSRAASFSGSRRKISLIREAEEQLLVQMSRIQRNTKITEVTTF